jgi:hypothetical protein
MAVIPCECFGRSGSPLGLRLHVYIEVEKASTSGMYITERERSIGGRVLLQARHVTSTEGFREIDTKSNT